MVVLQFIQTFPSAGHLGALLCVWVCVWVMAPSLDETALYRNGMQAVKVFLLGLLSKEDSHVTLTLPAVSPALWLR